MALLVRQRSAIWGRVGIVFVHIPKSAGTSINLSLYGQFMGHPRALDVKRWAPSDVKLLPAFAVARNPWDRLVSAYRFARLGEGVGGKFQARVWQPEQYQIPEFATFERFVYEWLVTKNVRKIDKIFQPQVIFVSDRVGKVIVDHVGRVENLLPTYEFIRSHLGKISTLTRSNSSGEKVDYRDFYNPRLVELVGKIYAEDVNAFGYDF
jgi:hypothetical protein